VDSQPKTQRSGREKTKCKHTVSNPNYSTRLGWKWGKRGESSPFYRGNPKFPPPMAERPCGHRPARTLYRVRAGPWPCDACPRASARTRFLPRGRPDGHFHPKTSVMTSLITTQSRALSSIVIVVQVELHCHDWMPGL
jgi:hypothetical protein